MEYRELFAKFFPYRSYRMGQLKAIRFLFEAFKNGSIALLSSPCGTGKSVSVLTAYMAVRSLGLSKRLLVLTRTRNQLEIYCREARRISQFSSEKFMVVPLTSRKHMCPKASSNDIKNIPYGDFLKYCKSLRSHALNERCSFYESTFSGRRPSWKALKALDRLEELGASTPHEVFKLCVDLELCPYEISKLLLRKADVVVGSYNYLFMDAVRESIFAKASIHLEDIICVVDEAHSLPSYLTELTTETISTVSLERAFRECERYGSNAAEYLKRLLTVVKRLGDDLQVQPDEARLLEDAYLEEVLSGALDANRYGGLLEFARFFQEEGETIRSIKISEGLPPVSYTSRVGVFLEHIIKSELSNFVKYVEGFTFRDGSLNYRIGLRLLDPSPVASVLNGVYTATLMSGTLWDMSYYVEVLGLDKSRIDKLELPYPFPEENRAIFVDVGVTTKFTKRSEEEWVKIADHIKVLRKSVEGAMALYFPSYEVMNAIKRYFEDFKTPVMYEDEDTSFEDIYKFLTANSNPTVMAVARGKVSEGVDFSDEVGSLLSAVVIVGLPYPKKTELHDALTKYFTEKFGEKGYEYANVNPCINALAQAAGRLIRKPEDKGIIVIMDSRTVGHIAEKLPEDWRRNMRIFRKIENLARAIKDFQNLWKPES
ncbi:ATP-dependent DNA helicase [Candidatus Bathyarchaeota archaeon]|nr:ATP-dependent DNA helicase [Candidatus Bathyarchaeota archaeon]MBS7612698.1 ATP-dependent DNA helicase [Candidatus Bathyarchaeota archaeon]MBS7618206.1 ATP-dependent DNA helicase [Candidatus Bathyarchaeota archaeon]